MSPYAIVAICLGALTVLLLVAAFFCAGLACARMKNPDFDNADELAKSRFRNYAEYVSHARAWLREHPYEMVSVQSFDGLRLAGRFVPCPKNRGTILMFHGWRSAPYVDFGQALDLYWQQGLNILLVDQRAHGDSEGRYITYGIKERRDVHSWIAWHNDRFGDQAPLVITGLSMGATTVMMACGSPLPENVRCAIVDCGFTSPYDIIRKVVKDMHLPPWLVMPVIGLGARVFGGFGLKACSTTEAVAQMSLPIFFVHGTKDDFVPWEMTKKSYDACASKDKTLFLVPEAGHGLSYIVEPERYRQKVTDLVSRTLT